MLGIRLRDCLVLRQAGPFQLRLLPADVSGSREGQERQECIEYTFFFGFDQADELYQAPGDDDPLDVSGPESLAV